MDFPHLNDTKFPNVGNVDVYAYQNEFDYPRWKPNTKAYLVNVRWNGDYSDCVKFDSDEARDDWFDALVANTIEDNPDCAVTLDKLGTNFIQNFIKVPLPYDRAAQFNYLVVDVPVMTSDEFDYQSDRHCAKTIATRSVLCNRFDYQSDRRCAKTRAVKEWLQENGMDD